MAADKWQCWPIWRERLAIHSRTAVPNLVLGVVQGALAATSGAWHIPYTPKFAAPLVFGGGQESLRWLGS